MTFEPAVHLHFEISNDCTKCCPRVFSCCCCRGEQDEVIVRKNRLISVTHASSKARRKTKKVLFDELIPQKLSEAKWEEIRPKVQEMLDMDTEDDSPLTKNRLMEITRIINEIIMRESK